ncbi:MAG: efflux RND transporter periplasmic adaptor subunit [Deltaproteobacteria bacterium]|nr:MAG: efflux RND transporter periplasmic adaptor subunit [Deltaproteobacteria bacterium]
MKLRLQPLLVAALLLIVFGCGEKIEPGTSKTELPVLTGVRIDTAQMVSKQHLYEAVGTVQAGITSNLASKVMSTVKRITVREGDRVKTGDTLIVLDRRQMAAKLRQAQAGLSEAKQALTAAISARDAAATSAELARTTYERYEALKREDSVSLQEFDEMEARHRQAQAAVQQARAMVSAAASRVTQAQAAVAVARVAVNDTLITAPHAGVITAKLVDEGDLASPGHTLLTLETTDGYRLDLVVPEVHIDHVRLGQKVLANVPALNLANLEGTVNTISPAADPASRSFLVKATLPADAPVKSGVFARVRIPLDRNDKLLVPLTAVVSHGQLTGLFLVDAESIAHFRLVRLGGISQESVEILAGLTQGDRYVVEPPPTLVDGAKVEAVP